MLVSFISISAIVGLLTSQNSWLALTVVGGGVLVILVVTANRVTLSQPFKVCDAYLQLIPFIDEFESEIHLDINTDPQHGSYCAAKEAAGYVLGMTGVEPKLKPDGFAASYGADGVAQGRSQRVTVHT